MQIDTSKNQLAELFIIKKKCLRNMNIHHYSSPGWMTEYNELQITQIKLKRIYGTKAIRN